MDYDLWKTGYYEDAEDSSSCAECTDIKQRFDQATEFLQGICEQLYGRETFDRNVLDRYIEELCWYLNVPAPKDTLKVYAINSKESKLFNFTLNIAKELNPKTNQKTINF